MDTYAKSRNRNKIDIKHITSIFWFKVATANKILYVSIYDNRMKKYFICYYNIKLTTCKFKFIKKIQENPWKQKCLHVTCEKLFFMHVSSLLSNFFLSCFATTWRHISWWSRDMIGSFDQNMIGHVANLMLNITLFFLSNF